MDYSGKYRISGSYKINDKVIDFTGSGKLTKQNNFYSLSSEYSDSSKYDGFITISNKTGKGAANNDFCVGCLNIMINKNNKIQIKWSTLDKRKNIIVIGSEEWTKI